MCPLPVLAVPVLPLGKLGSSLGHRAKGAQKLPKRGAKLIENEQIDVRNSSKLTKEGCKFD